MTETEFHHSLVALSPWVRRRPTGIAAEGVPPGQMKMPAEMATL